MADRFRRLCRSPRPGDGNSKEFVVLKCPHDDTELAIHATLLAHHSQYFRQFLNEKSEAKSHTFCVPEKFSITTLRLFIDWLYKTPTVPFPGNPSVYCYHGSDLVIAWEFGNYIKAPAFQNDMIRCLMCRDLDGDYGTEFQWDSISSGGALESLLLDISCRHILNWRRDEIQPQLDGLSSSLVGKLMHHMLQGMQEQVYKSLPRYRNGRFQWRVGKIAKYLVPEEDNEEDSDNSLRGMIVFAAEECPETSTTAPPPASLQTSNTSEPLRLVSGGVSDKGTSFVPFELVKKYPYMYVGKSNKTRVVELFKKTLCEVRAWDVFSLCHPTGARGPLLLIPTIQFEQFLDTLNAQFNGKLAIPEGSAGEQFSLTFGQWDTPRPRFLERANNARGVDALIARAQTLPADDLSHLTPACYRTYCDKVDEIYGSLNPTTEGMDKATRKRIRKRKECGRMLKRVQRYLGLRKATGHMSSHMPSKNSVATNWNVSKPAPFRPKESVRFVCVDVEADEKEATRVTEIGLAVLDTEDLIDTCPGEKGENWFPLVQAHHIRIKERCYIVNSEFVNGCPEAFDFGESQIVPLDETNDAISKIIGDKKSKDERPVVIVGHDIKQDLDYLRGMGYESRSVPHIVDEVDTKDMFQRLERSSDGRSLATICAELGVLGHNYHNAGNDAVYTLQAMIAIAIKRTVEGSDRNEDSFTPGTDEWTDGDMDDGGCPKRSAPPVEHKSATQSNNKRRNAEW
ncbi:hypothetical protein O1611_g3560 [Lasiodiplodia mahajangana]|uniref:Uncharacterized protein n=1 Tax=Lasiodiplodia mahajangana TaxID=1108764 RepID=A0ACC2JRH8_9PEZI|nr:hypothetical protein O1611_g3560 [Lasiodiplodia mahajangana]